MLSDFATSSTCASSVAASGTPFLSRSLRRAARPIPGTRISSLPGSRRDEARSRMWRSTSALNTSGGTKPPTSSAVTQCPTIPPPPSRAAKSPMSPPHAPPVERSRQQPGDDREPAALVAPHGEVGALVDAVRIRDRRAILAILHPALRHRLAVELVAPDGAVRRERGGDIQNHRRFLPARDRH